MNIGECLLIFLGIALLSIPFCICYRFYKVVKKSKNIKHGDLYKWEYHYSNPFLKPIIMYAKVHEIKFSGIVPWVKYSICGVSEILKYEELSDFLENYIPCKEERNENV